LLTEYCFSIFFSGCNQPNFSTQAANVENFLSDFKGRGALLALTLRYAFKTALMLRFLRSWSLLAILVCSSCVSYYQDQRPDPSLLSSPPFAVNPEVFYGDNSRPTRPYVSLSEESFYSDADPKWQLTQMLMSRSLDGAIINYRAYSSNEAVRDVPPSALSYLVAALDSSYVLEGGQEYYTQHNHYLEFQAFIYLDNIDERKFLDRVEVSVLKGDSLWESMEFEFDWQGQIMYMPANLKEEHFLALAVQPWFFLDQSNMAWRSRPILNSRFPNRVFQSGGLYAKYRSTAGSNYIHLVHKGRYDLILGQDQSGRWRLKQIKTDSQYYPISNQDFFGLTLEEEWLAPNGFVYRYKYTYKKSEQVPQEWITRP